LHEGCCRRHDGRRPQWHPREAFDALNDALARGEWQAVALALDPDDVATFRDRELAVLTDRAAVSALARRENRRVTSWSSQAVLNLDRLAEFGSEPQVPFPGTPTLSQLASLSPLQFLVACMEAHAAGEERMIAHVRKSQLAADHKQATEPKCRVIGQLAEGDRLVHILYRWDSQGGEDHPTHVHLRTFRSMGGEWRVSLDHELSMYMSPMFAFSAFEEPLEPDSGLL
jgi:hypothetical protein